MEFIHYTSWAAFIALLIACTVVDLSALILWANTTNKDWQTVTFAGLCLLLGLIDHKQWELLTAIICLPATVIVWLIWMHHMHGHGRKA